MQLAAGLPHRETSDSVIWQKHIQHHHNEYQGSPRMFAEPPPLHSVDPTHNTNIFVKFVDDTTVVGLISSGEETNYRNKVNLLAPLCRDNNLSLNVEEMVVDFWRTHTQPTSDVR